MDKDIVPSKEEKIIVGEAENIQEEEIQPVGGKLSEEFETTAETFPENDSKGKLPEELKDMEQETEQESDRTELFQEELEPEAIAEKLKPVTDTFSETMEEAGLLNEVTEAQTDHSVVSNQEQKKSHNFQKSSLSVLIQEKRYTESSEGRASQRKIYQRLLSRTTKRILLWR